MKKLSLLLALLLLCVSLAACGIGKKGISPDEFRAIEIGMDMYAIGKIVGGREEELVSEEYTKDGDYETFIHVYKIRGEKGGYALFTDETVYWRVGDLRYPHPSGNCIKKESYNLK